MPSQNPPPGTQGEPVGSSKATAKAEARQAAIAEAAGPLLVLPTLVDRSSGGPWPASPADVEQLLEILTTTDRPLTVDVETTGYPIGHADYALRTIQLGCADFAVVLDAADPGQAELAKRHLAAASRLHAHSATADLVPLAAAGLVDADSAWGRMHDTVIAAKLADPASTGSDPGLKRLAATVLGEAAVSTAADVARAALFKAGRWLTDTKVTTPPERSGWAQVDPACVTMVRYAAADVLDTAALAASLPWPDRALLDRERAAQRMTARVTHHGLRIDGEHVAELLARHTASRAGHAERVRAFGIDNPGSGQQVAARLAAEGAVLPQTPGGRPSVAEGVLEPLRATPGPVGAISAAVLDYRHDDTVLGTFLEPYHQLVIRGDSRARPTVYTLGADTGRMSCVRPNLQQLPREGGIRACITADPGQLLISADFAGVELRVAAALSQDAGLIRMLGAGTDLHWECTRQVFGPDATKADRYRVKRGVFGWLYGGSVPTLARHMGVDEQTARAMVDTLADLAPGLTAWTRHVSEQVKAGQTRFQTYSGRVAHLPERAPHAGPNYCIQGTARELLIDALLRWGDTRWGRCVLLPVHDELLVAVPEADAAEATDALVAAMATELHGVAIVAEPSAPAYAWADAS